MARLKCPQMRNGIGGDREIWIPRWSSDRFPKDRMPDGRYLRTPLNWLSKGNPYNYPQLSYQTSDTVAHEGLYARLQKEA